jgi:hypothetical protein
MSLQICFLFTIFATFAVGNTAGHVLSHLGTESGDVIAAGTASSCIVVMIYILFQRLDLLKLYMQDLFPDKTTVNFGASFSIQYHGTYKILTNTQVLPPKIYLLYQRGCPTPKEVVGYPERIFYIADVLMTNVCNRKPT